jgi:hypothetical protein
MTEMFRAPDRGWRSLSQAGDLRLIDGEDFLPLAKAVGLSAIHRSAVGAEDEIARTLSRVIWEAAMIARSELLPPAKKEKRRWEKTAKHTASLLELLDTDGLASLQAQALLQFQASSKENPHERLRTFVELLPKVRELATAIAARKRRTGRPSERAEDWLMAGVAGCYERVVGERPRNDGDEQSFSFAREAIKLIVRRMDERWAAAEDVGTARLTADPGYQAIKALIEGCPPQRRPLSEATLAARMADGATLWGKSQGVLCFSVP